MRRFTLSLGVLIVTAAVGRAAPVTSIDQITTVVGTGSNEAAFVFNWKNGQANDSIVIGYRWTGTATAEDMLRAIAGANIGIYATLGDFGTPLGFAVFGIGYDANHDGKFSVSPSLTFVNGIATENRDKEVVSSRTATDPTDFYTEDWFGGLWSYWLSTDGSNWDFAPVGISSEVLHNGDRDGFSLAAAFNANPPDPAINPSLTAVVPVPASLVLVTTAWPVLLVFRRRREELGPA